MPTPTVPRARASRYQFCASSDLGRPAQYVNERMGTVFGYRVMTDSVTANAKVVIRVTYDDGSVEVETLWATALGNDEYKLDNSPFYAYSVSWEDIVYAPYDPLEERPTFQRVIKKSGNRTVRIKFDPPVEDGNSSDQLLKGLVALGCSYEGANRGYMAINIPGEVRLDLVRDYLVSKSANWEHADPRYSELYPGDAS